VIKNTDRGDTKQKSPLLSIFIFQQLSFEFVSLFVIPTNKIHVKTGTGILTTSYNISAVRDLHLKRHQQNVTNLSRT